MNKNFWITFFCHTFFTTTSFGKYFSTNCELLEEILQVSNLPLAKAAEWSCVANSGLNTQYDAGNFIGIFQIGKEWWCSPDGGGICNIQCSKLLDDDIKDDLECAFKIYKGFDKSFNAWPGSEGCISDSAKDYINDCPNIKDDKKDTKGSRKRPDGK